MELMTEEELYNKILDAEIEQSGTVLRTVFNMSFAGLLIVPILWFIYFAFYREPDWRFRQ